MKVKDKVFGEVEIKEPILVDIINSPEIQRLKKIDQSGYLHKYFPSENVYRFDHSLNDFLILEKFGASLEEQIAGLIHDLSHSAFSHCIDHVLNKKDADKQSHQDNIFVEFVRKTSVPGIIKKYNLDVEYILDEHNFPLQERDAPDLCADRLSYSFIDSLKYKVRNINQINEYIDNLIIIDNKWIFKNYGIAYDYAKMFFHVNKIYYTGISTAAMFISLSKYLEYALEKKYITKNDLYTDDQTVLDKINKNLKTDEELKKLWKKVDTTDWFVECNHNYDESSVCKSRIVDPLFIDGEKVKRVSDKNKKWKDVVREESKPKKRYLRYI